MKRYDLVKDDSNPWHSDHYMADEADGEWVRYEDVQALVAERDEYKRSYELVNAQLCEIMRSERWQSKLLLQQWHQITALVAERDDLQRENDQMRLDYEIGEMVEDRADR